jgi:hypothetical protein
MTFASFSPPSASFLVAISISSSVQSSTSRYGLIRILVALRRLFSSEPRAQHTHFVKFSSTSFQELYQETVLMSA